MLFFFLLCFFFFFKQKTAYEMRISDWSSDVCSSDLAESVQKAMAGLGSAASGLPAAWSAWPAALGSLLAAARPDTVGKEQESHGRKPAPAPGPAPAAAAPDGGGADLGVLADRLAALAQRVHALAGHVGYGGPGGACPPPTL